MGGSGAVLRDAAYQRQNGSSCGWGLLDGTVAAGPAEYGKPLQDVVVR